MPWVETQSIQDALDTHVCNLDTALLYMCREYFYNARVTVTRTLRSFVVSSNVGILHHPVLSDKEAEEWLYYYHGSGNATSSSNAKCFFTTTMHPGILIALRDVISGTTELCW